MVQRYTFHHFDDEDKMMSYINNMDPRYFHVVTFLPSKVHTWVVLIEHRMEP